MKNLKILSLLPVLTLICGCAPGGQNNEEYIEKKVPVYGFNNEKLESATCRFYEEYETIPYIDINSYYKYLLNKEVEISTISKNNYLVETYKGSATIDVANDILYSDDYNQFINTTIYRSGDSHNVYYDNAPYLKVGEHHPSKEVTPKTIDFSKYKVDFKYEDNKLWAPLITYSDMFKGVTMIQTFYNGNAIYLVDSNNNNINPAFATRGYYPPIAETFYKENQRDPKVAELSYYEMCFVIDNYYGLPGRSPLDDMISEHGLDYTLENYSDSTRLTKQFLLSTKLSEYMAGMTFMGNLFDDGGHTVMDAGTSYLGSSGAIPSHVTQTSYYLANNSGYEPISNTRNINYNAYFQARENANNNKMFNYKGDTFVYTFDGFDIDYDAWHAFYAGETAELPNDAIGNLHKGIALAKQNENIKNFVLDISINGGGFGDVVIYLMKVLANHSSMYYYDHIDERNVKQDYYCDINLDGEFNELDNEPLSDFNYGIITSEISFSCGNLLPALAKDMGIALIGDNSGGGACAVLDNCSMEGIYYRLSSFVHFTNTSYESIDAGIEVDYNIVDNDGLNTISNLYNLDIISEKMNDFYK